MIHFDYRKLTSLILDATSKAFRHVSVIAGAEHLYAFGLYTSEEFAYLTSTANSEEALTRTAEAYATRSGGPVELHRLSLRWSPCDWGYHLQGEEFFCEVQEVLNNSFDNQLGEYTHDPEKVEAICIRVLSEIKQQADKVAGKPINGIHFNLLKGDQSSEERIEYANLLNTKDEVARFRLEVEQGIEAFFKLQQGLV